MQQILTHPFSSHCAALYRLSQRQVFFKHECDANDSADVCKIIRGSRVETPAKIRLLEGQRTASVPNSSRGIAVVVSTGNPKEVQRYAGQRIKTVGEWQWLVVYTFSLSKLCRHLSQEIINLNLSF